MRTVAIVQARAGSSRLPNKVMMDLCGHPVLWHIHDRVRRSKWVDDFVVATSVMPENDGIEAFALQNGIHVFRGSEENVLERFYLAAKEAAAEIVIRLTGDNALVCPEIIDEGAAYFEQTQTLDYLCYREGLPLGLSVEVIGFHALERAYQEADDAECLEHVTPYLYRNPGQFHCYRYPCIGEDYSRIRWTVDTQEDYNLVRNIYESLYTEGGCFGYQEALQIYLAHPQWAGLNSSVVKKKILYSGNHLQDKQNK